MYPRNTAPKAIWFSICTITLLGIASCRMAELRNPDPFVAASTVEGNREAIKKALANRGWQVEQESTGHIDAVLYIRKHVAKIGIDYDDEQVTMYYRDSQNLKYEEKKTGKKVIHKNYNSWVRNLVRDTSKFAAAADKKK